MQTRNPFFDDVARVAGGALGALSGVKAELEGLVRQQLDKLLSGANLVSREEFEVVEAMARKARAENEALSARLAALEARLSDSLADDGDAS